MKDLLKGIGAATMLVCAVPLAGLIIFFRLAEEIADRWSE